MTRVPMKRIFVCSPFGGKAENLKKAREYCARVREAGHAPFAPHLLYPQFLDESDPAERVHAIEMGLAFLLACDEVWIFESEVTPGMETEIACAQANGIPVILRVDD